LAHGVFCKAKGEAGEWQLQYKKSLVFLKVRCSQVRRFAVRRFERRTPNAEQRTANTEYRTAEPRLKPCFMKIRSALAFFLLGWASLLSAQIPANTIGANPLSLKWNQIRTDRVQVIFPRGLERQGSGWPMWRTTCGTSMPDP